MLLPEEEAAGLGHGHVLPHFALSQPLTTRTGAGQEELRLLKF
jgi:hypothetical protein